MSIRLNWTFPEELESEITCFKVEVMFGSQVVVSKDARTTAVNLSGGSYHFVSVAAVYPDGESANGIGIQDVWFNEGSGVDYGSPILLATLLCVTGTMAILVVIWKLRRRG